MQQVRCSPCGVQRAMNARHMCCFAAYYARSIDELSGRTTGRLGYIRPDKAHAIRGTAELALRYSIISAFTAGPKHCSVMTRGRPVLLEHGQRPRTCRARRTVLRDYGTAGAADAAVDPPPPPDLPGTTGWPRAVDAAGDSAEAFIPSEGLRAGRRCRRTMPEYKRTTRPRDLPGAGRCVSLMHGTRSQAVHVNFRQGPGWVQMLNYSGSIFRRRSPHRRLGLTTFEEIRCKRQLLHK